MEDGRCFNNETKDLYCVTNSNNCVEGHFPEIQAVVLSILSVTCFIINGLLIKACIVTKYVSESIKIFTVNLSISYLLVGIYVIPMWTISVFHSQLIFPKYLCFFHPYVIMVTVTEAQLSLAAIALDRCLTILYPLRYPVVATNKKIYLCVAIMWIVSFLIALPPFFGWGKYCFRPRTMPVCSISWTDDSSFAVFIFCIGFIGPLFVMFYSYLKISLIARKIANDMQQTTQAPALPVTSISSTLDGNTSNTLCLTTNEQNLPRQVWNTTGSSQPKNNVSRSLRVLKVVLISVGVLLFCWVPYSITTIWHIIHKDEVLGYGLEFTVTLFTYFNCFTNPLIFILLNRDYRRHVRRLYRKLRYRNNSVRQSIVSFTEFNTGQTTARITVRVQVKALNPQK